jgi:hypothetical protein
MLTSKEMPENVKFSKSKELREQALRTKVILTKPQKKP